MKLSAVGLVVMCSVLTGCSSWIPTVANNGINYGINVGRAISADRSLFNVLDDLSIKNTINNALLDEALILDISTDVYQGMVMLTGSVKDATTRQKAEDLARKVDGVRELYNDIQVADEVWFKSLPTDLFIEGTLAARMVLAPDLTSVNYQLRAANGVVYVMGIAKSRAELDQVIALARESGARRIVSHVFLTEHITLDGAPETAAAAKVESESAKAGDEPARAGPQTNEIKTKSDANRAKKKSVSRSAPARTAAP
jgi:osmotically-inducible protein OsmY